MSHEKPSYYRYVSSIAITNAGSGYDSANPPAITISGGGGTGATATCTVVGGAIATVTVTNIGSGYTSTPSVAVAGSGGAVLTATTSFSGGTPSSITRKSSTDIKYTLPEYVRTEYAGSPSFVSFLEKYYEHMDEEDSPINILLNKRYYDIDTADAEELDKWRAQLAHNFPKSTNVDRLTLYKYLKSIYESKGSKRSIEAFFKVVYDEDIELVFPSQYVLRASDGVWIEDKNIRVFAGYNNYEVLELKGDLVDIVYYETTGSITVDKRIPAEVNNVGKIAYTAPQKYDLVLGLSQTTTSIPGPGAQAAATATVVAGEITDFTISNGGYQYTAAPTIEIYDISATPGSGFEGRAVVEDGVVTSIVITDGGTGYSTVPGEVTVVFNTDDVRSFIVDRGATLAEENVRAYLDRTLATVTSNAYVGSNAGFKVGDVFRIQETGDDGRGYAIDYFAQDYVFIGGGNNAIIRVREVNTNNVPTSWEIINPGSGFLNFTSTITVTSDIGEDLDITITTNYLFLPSGRYKDDRGKLSDVNKLQDNNKWQSYSYIIKSGLPKGIWESAFKQVGHIAGMEVFGDLVLTSELDYSGIIDVVSPGLEIYFFEVDEVSISDTSITFNFDKTLADNATASEAQAKSISKALSDSTLNTVNGDVGSQTYFAEDYVDNEFYVRDVGFFIEYSKEVSDAATASEVINPVTTWSRAFTENATVSEVFVTLLVLQQSFSDSASVAESSVFSIAPNPSDSVSSSESIDTFNFGKNIFDNTSATESITSINTNKPLTDTASVSESDAKDFTTSRSDTATTSDSGTITGPQNYVEPTYFAEDYMVGVTLGTF